MAAPRLLHAAGQRVTFKNETGSTSSYNSGQVYEYDENENDMEEPLVEGSRRRKSKTAKTRNNSFQDSRFLFDQDFSDFHTAFRQSFSMTQAPNSLAGAEPANGAEMTNESKTQQTATDDRMSVSFSDQGPGSVVPAKRPSVDIAQSSKRAKTGVEDSSSPPPKRPSVERKGLSIARSPRPRGTGIYKTGTWDYAPDDDQGAEKISKVVNEISATIEASTTKPAKVTRNSYHKMKSTLQGGSAVTTPSQERQPAPGSEDSSVIRSSLQPDQSVRRSSRARNVPDYSSFQAAEIDEDLPDPAESTSPTVTKQCTPPSTLHSHASHESAPGHDELTRSTSASTAPQQDANIEQAVRPKKTWTAIVYEVIANAKKPNLTLAEIGEDIKERYPYFKSLAHSDTLKSSPRNPLYAHPAFRKVQREDGKLAWGLYPGNFYDKKTGKLLTAGSPVANVVPSVAEDATQDDAHNSDAAAAAPVTNDTSDVRIKPEYRPIDWESLRFEDSDIVRIPYPENESSSRELEAEAPRNAGIDRLSPGIGQGSARSSCLRAEANAEPAALQPPGSTALQSKDQRRLAGIVHKNLVDSFTDEEMDLLLQETKLWYFKYMDLKKRNLDQILEIIMPSGLKSSDEEITACAEDLRKDYEARTWESDWFLNFVSNEVTTYDTHMGGFTQYMSRTKLMRLDHWTHSKLWNRNSFTEVFSAFNDTVDLNKVWVTKQWQDFARKIFCTACDATWEHRFEPGGTAAPHKVFSSIRSALNERYPDRSTKIWDVPRLHPLPAEVASRKASVVSNASVPGRNSAVERVTAHEVGRAGKDLEAGSVVQETQNIDTVPSADRI